MGNVNLKAFLKRAEEEGVDLRGCLMYGGNVSSPYTFIGLVHGTVMIRFYNQSRTSGLVSNLEVVEFSIGKHGRSVLSSGRNRLISIQFDYEGMSQNEDTPV